MISEEKKLVLLKMLKDDVEFKIRVDDGECEELQIFCFKNGVFFEGFYGITRIKIIPHGLLRISYSESVMDELSIKIFNTQEAFVFSNLKEFFLHDKKEQSIIYSRGKRLNTEQCLAKILAGKPIYVNDDIFKLIGDKIFKWEDQWEPLDKPLSIESLVNKCFFEVDEDRNITLSATFVKKIIGHLSNDSWSGIAEGITELKRLLGE